jgi:hypothetical protein
MCFLNFTPYDDDGPGWPLPRGRPRVAWVVPVDMCKLGAGLQAFTDTALQINTLRLCHRFHGGPLSKLPQELLEHIIDETQRMARLKYQSEWYQDSICWQGTCRPEDHFSVYGEHIEKLWQKIFIDKHYGETRETELDKKTNTEKIEMVFESVMMDPETYHEWDESYGLHIDARFRWLARTCQCSDPNLDLTTKVGHFIPLNQVSKCLVSAHHSRVLNFADSKVTIWTRSNHTSRDVV